MTADAARQTATPLVHVQQEDPRAVFRWTPGEKRVFVYWPDDQQPFTSFSVWDYSAGRPRIYGRVEFNQECRRWYAQNREALPLYRHPARQDSAWSDSQVIGLAERRARRRWLG